MRSLGPICVPNTKHMQNNLRIISVLLSADWRVCRDAQQPKTSDFLWFLFFISFVNVSRSLCIYSAQFNCSYVLLYMHVHRSGCVNWIEWNEFFCRISRFVLFLVYSLAFICSIGKCCASLSGFLIVICSLRVSSALKWKTHVYHRVPSTAKEKIQPKPAATRRTTQSEQWTMLPFSGFSVTAKAWHFSVNKLILFSPSPFLQCSLFRHKCSWRCFRPAIV